MESKVDKTIEVLCNYIEELTKSQVPMEVAENTKALASLVEARAKLSDVFIPSDSKSIRK